jgi:hypothetical protein
MKSRNMVMTKITIQPNVEKTERSKSAPTTVETRLRVFEIHTDGSRIHRLALDPLQEAHGFENGSRTRKEKRTGNEMGHRDDIEIRAGHSVKSSSLFARYHILRTQYHWTVFQAIRYALWLAR